MSLFIFCVPPPQFPSSVCSGVMTHLYGSMILWTIGIRQIGFLQTLFNSKKSMIWGSSSEVSNISPTGWVKINYISRYFPNIHQMLMAKGAFKDFFFYYIISYKLSRGIMHGIWAHQPSFCSQTISLPLIVSAWPMSGALNFFMFKFLKFLTGRCSRTYSSFVFSLSL